ncbi:MAG: alpha/beta fold hydrolase [Beijerinckiaceae bacterium]
MATSPLQPGEGEHWNSFWSTSQDGLKLHARLYGAEHTNRLPVVCLAGLTRSSADFHEIAVSLATHRTRPRQVLSLDYRGRGRSDYDSNHANYDIPVELQDVQDVLTAAGIHEAIFIGTSRGGLIAMAMSAVRPGCIKGVVLNDIGPVIDGKGLARIKSYVGKLPQPKNYAEAVQILKRVASQHFTRLSDAEWEVFARRSFKETDRGLVPDYDINLMKSLLAYDLEKPLPTIWPLFEGLKNVPVLSIRGEHSDLFSAETQSEMQKRHPQCDIYTVVGEGHAPLLGDRPTMQKISTFVTMAEDRSNRRAA